MSDTETVVNGLSDSDALSDNEHTPVGEKAPQRKQTYTASIARAVNSALCVSDMASEIVFFHSYVVQEKPNTTHQRKFRTPRFTISPCKHLPSLIMIPETYLRSYIPDVPNRRCLEIYGLVGRDPD
jgi:hypothetical protein